MSILDDIGVKAYQPPLSTIRDLPTWPSMSEPLHVAILLIDFDTEVTMSGLLGFLENSTGAYLDQTIEAFRLVGDNETVATLTRVRDAMSTGLGFNVVRFNPPLKQWAIFGCPCGT